MSTKKASPRPPLLYAGPGYQARTAAFTPAAILDLPDVTYLTAGQVARVFGIAPRTAAVWFDAGRLAGVVLPGTKTRRFFRASVRELAVEMGVVPAAGEACRPAVATLGLAPADVSALADALRVAVLDTPAGDPFAFAFRLPADLLAAVVSASVGRDVALGVVKALADFTRRPIAVVTAPDDYASYEFRTAGASILLRAPLDARQIDRLAAGLTRTPAPAGAK